MKQKITLALLCILFTSVSFSQQKRTCHAMEDLEERKLKDPILEQRMQQIESFTQKKVKELESLHGKVEGDIITLPVVVHVLYTNSTNNISDAQIQSQLDVLNADFRRTNSDRTNKWAQAADSQIEFRLATVAPDGSATTGVTRTQVSKSTWLTGYNNMKKSSEGGVDAWDTSEYLNMWIVDNITRPTGGTILGYAQFPGGDADTDGVVMADQYFGTTGTAQAPFDGGRTTTHEVGHFLNLRHIWGDGDCGADDFVTDTPNSDGANYGCQSGSISCGSEDMVQNYMDYSDDSCMNLFTTGQKNRMRTVLLAGGARRSLALSDKFGEGNGGGPIVTEDPCNGGVTLTENSGSFVDGSGNNDYSNNKSCTWLIKPENGGKVTLNFTSYDTESGYDFVTVYDGENDNATQLGRFSGTSLPNAVTATGNAMYVKFTTDGSVTAAGWAASYTSKATTADTTAPTVPTTLTTSNVAQTSLTLSWSASTDNVGVTGYDVYQGATKLGTTTSTSTNITGLTAATSYIFSVRAKDAAGNFSEVKSVNITTLANALSYCESEGSNSSYEWIDNVELGGMKNATGDNGGYQDFTSKIATLTQGSSNNTMIVSAGFKSSAYTEHWAVWIDFDQDGTFDSSEKVVSGSSSSANNLSASIDVPANAKLGNTRMRVSMKYNASQTACETFSYGEVEDYTVNITSSLREYNVSGGDRLGNETSLSLITYPNPANDFVQVRLSSKSDTMTYKIVNTIGRVVQSGSLNNRSLNVSNLNTGVYILEVNDGQKLLTTKIMKK